MTDPAGNWKQLVTDVSGNQVTVLEPDPANPPSGTLLTGYSYDWMNHVIQTSMTRAGTTQTRSFVYNNAGQLTSATNVENGTVSYTYNSDSTLASKQDAKGQVEVYTYDSKKRVIEVQEYPTGLGGSEDTCQRVTYGYDAGTYGIGRLTSAGYYGCPPSSVPYTYTEAYSYGAPGGITRKAFVVNTTGWSSAASMSMSYSYDSAGRLSTDAPNGSTFTYSYDSMGRPVSLTDAYGTAWTQNGTYDLAGRLTSLQLYKYLYAGSPVYTTETRSYNANRQLSTLGWSGSGTLTYNYSSAANNGQITQMVDTISGETVSYSYDLLKRLTSASSTASWTQTFGYDGFGNLTSKVLNGTTTTIAVTAATNRLTYSSYDANGNMLTGVGATFTYDERNRLSTASPTSGGTAYYSYAPDNKRIYQKTATGVEDWYVYNPRGERIGTYTIGTSGSYPYLTPYFVAAQTNVWFGKRLVNRYSVATYTTSAVLRDRLGSDRSSGERYYPYGDEITSTANDTEKFGTYFRDSFTTLDYADQRYYASSYGRFNTADPYQALANGANDPSTPLSWNKYAYVLGDPVNWLDPRGMDEQSPEGGPPPSPGLSPCTLNPQTCNVSGPTYSAGPTLPPCPPTPAVNGLPAGSTASQIAANVALAQQQSSSFMSLATSAASGDPEGPSSSTLYLAYMAQWLVGQFSASGTTWNYKNDPTVVSQNPGNYQSVVDFGNFNFGAVMEGLGLTMYEAQNAAGIYQEYIALKGTGAPGQGIPLFQFPYGDQAQDQQVIQRGFKYETFIQAGCR